MVSRRQASGAGFEPSGERGRLLDRHMRVRLASSLAYIFDQIGADLKVTATDAQRVVQCVKAGRQSPQLFGAYYDLVLAVERDGIGEARRFAREIMERVDAPSPEQWIGSVASRPRRDQDRCQRLLLPEDIIASEPSASEFAAAVERIDAAMRLLEAGFPQMAAEIRALLFEIVIAVGPTEKGAITFDGSSSYMLWGAIMLNALGQTTILDTAQALAHESGHNLLFGFCADGPLIENDDEEAFAHPLRQDPRPMDGVVHAAYVTARMHQTVERLLESGVLDADQRQAAEKDLDLHQRNFAAADEVIRSAALLTQVGQQAMAAARAQVGALV